MDCPECARLVTEHQRLKKVYATSVESFFATAYHATDAAHKKLKRSIEDARAQAEIARLKIDKHRLSVHSKAS
jgi:hypothetical protein